jgi:hypothetical protein
LEINSTPSQAQAPPHQPSRSIVDQNGWVAIDKSDTGHNCIEMDRSALQISAPPQQQLSRRTVLKFDEPNSSLQRSNLHSDQTSSTQQQVTYPQAVVIEMDFQMKSRHSRPPNLTTIGRHPRDQRCFHKNIVRTLHEEEVTSSSSAPTRVILKKKDMDKVLPKESERELLVRYLGLTSLT